MNDDPGPSFAARQLLPPRSDGDDANGDEEQHQALADESRDDSRPSEDAESQKREKRRQGLLKKLELVTHLQKSLDKIVFAYICTLYYMECSFFRFLIRLFPHYCFLTPKNDVLLPAEHPPNYMILAPSVLCILAHLSFALPEAGEATRGYLHGGVIIDFIGQKPPRTRLAFLLFDLMILGVQCLMLAVLQEQEKVKKAVARSSPGFSPSGDQIEQAAATETTQDHDAEERGVLRDEAYLGEGGGVELRPLSGGDASRGSEAAADDEGDTYSSAAASADMLDIIRSGDAVLANFHVVHAVRTVGSRAQSATAYMLQTAGYGTTLAALAAQQRSRIMMRRQQRLQRQQER